MNAPQSSRVAGKINKSLFPNVNSSASMIKPTYYAQKTFTQAGENDIQIKQKEKAKIWHYVIGAGIIVGLVYVADKQLNII